MKKYLIAITMMLALGMNAQAASQKHRHTPRTEQVDTTKNNQNNQDAIEAFSDTTSSAAEDAEDDKYIRHRHGTVVYGSADDAKAIGDAIESVGGILTPMMVISVVTLVILFVILPLIILIAVFYFVNRNRKEKYKLAQMAIQNGQPIPDEILKDATKDDWERSDYQAGVRQMFTGVGLAIFLGLIIGKIGIGIGALVFFIGLGKWYIARQSGNIGNGPLNNPNNSSNSNQFNNNNSNI